MNQRDLLILGGTAIAWPLVVRAQQKAMQVIGVLAPNPKVFETLMLERDLAAPVLSGGPASPFPPFWNTSIGCRRCSLPR